MQNNCNGGPRAAGLATGAVALLLPGTGLAVQALPPAGTAGGWEREFTVYLEDRRIGTHRFEITAPGPDGLATVTSTASFQVKILGLTAYRYRHRAMEVWQAGCLVRLTSRTDDNGHASQVDAAPDGPGCTMGYAYWDKRLLAQHRLLNPQTGAFDTVEVQSLGRDTISAGGLALPAEHYRLTTAAARIELWYSPAGQWLQLDSTTHDGRRLRYRLT